MDINIRHAAERDIPALVEIVNWHIEKDHSSFFRTEPETESSLLKVLGDCNQQAISWLVAECGGQVVGSAKSKRFKRDKIYDKTVETGLSLHHRYLRKGIGYKLYAELLKHIQLTGMHVVIAGIAIPNSASVALHKKLGFREVGVFEEYACIEGKYFSTLWMQKILSSQSTID